MKKIAVLLICFAIMRPQDALAPLALAAEASAAGSGRSASLDGIEVVSDAVAVHLSDSVRYQAFVAANPPRLVLDFPGTELDLTAKNYPGRGKYLKSVRAAQFIGGLSPKTRVVLDLAQAAPYRASFEGSVLKIILGDTPEKAPIAAAKAAASTTVPAADPPKAAAPPAAATSLASVAPIRTSDAPASPAPSVDANKKISYEAGSFSTKVASEITAIGGAPSALPYAAGAFPPHSTAPEITGTFSRQRDILATLPRDVISLDFDSTDVGDVLKLLSSKAGFNIVYGADVTGPLTLHLTDVPFNEAFNMILTMKGLVATQPGENILRVATIQTLTNERANTIGVTRVFQINYKKAAEVKAEIDSVRTAEKRQGSSVSDDTNNQLIVTETPEGIAAVERLLAQIDVRPRQVLIETKIVEVSLNNDLELGIQWDYWSLEPGHLGGKEGYTAVGTPIAPSKPVFGLPLDQNSLGVLSSAAGAATVLGAGGTGRGTGVALPASNAVGAFTLGRITNNYVLSATLSAAASAGKAKVLSDPKIATLNGKSATINITSQVPYVTTTFSATGASNQTVAYTTTGIQLSVTPTITADGRVNLKVTPNVTKPSAIAATGAAATAGVIATDSRQADTTVLVRDGETIVIGGMITDSLNDVITKVPLLGDIPLIGWLFKKKSLVRSRAELLVFVTTEIMPD